MSSTDRAKRAAVYLLAAEREDGESERAYSACWAISRIVNPGVMANPSARDKDSWAKEVQAFWDYFEPDYSHPPHWWSSDEQDERVLALCFMAAITESP